MRNKRFVIGALLALVVGFGTTLVVPTAAMAAAACNSSSCNGRDPHSTGCDVGAYDLDNFTSPIDGYAYVQLRYSPSCNAAWARLTTGSSGMPSHSYLTLNVYHTASGGSPAAEYLKKVTDSTNNWGSGVVSWSYMNSYTDYVQACLKNIYEDGPCTARH
jgi:hypothetical protein